MPSTPYTLLPTQPTQEDADKVLQDAFGDDDEEEVLETTRLINSTHQLGLNPTQIPGAYDFERDYDYTLPPPGSPPRPSATALPNDYGNTNGFIPASPTITPLSSGQTTRRFTSFFRRAVGSLLPTHYQILPTDSPIPRLVGGGTQNDGVFANVMAKPVPTTRVVDPDGTLFLAPETVQSQAPPVCRHLHTITFR